jgi:hypothetical protein
MDEKNGWCFMATSPPPVFLHHFVFDEAGRLVVKRSVANENFKIPVRRRRLVQEGKLAGNVEVLAMWGSP